MTKSGGAAERWCHHPSGTARLLAAQVYTSQTAPGADAHTLTEGRLAETKAACSPAVRDVSRRSLTSSEAERAALRDTWTALSPAKEVASSALGCPLQTDSCRPHDAIS